MSINPRIRSSLPFVIVACLAACTQAGPGTPRAIVDLSPTITEDLPTRMVGEKLIADFGFRAETEFEQTIGAEPLYYQDSYITLFNHTGPHADAPVHVLKGGETVADYDLNRFYGRARVLDFSGHTSDSAISMAEVQAQGVEPGDIVILYTGYQPPRDPNAYPVFKVPTLEAVEYLAALPIKAYAVDLPSVDDLIQMFEKMNAGVTDAVELLPIHHVLLSKGIPAIEGLVNVDALLGEENILFAGFPLKMAQPAGDAGQIRAVALVY
jgi:kynurenine formamidase